MKKIICIGAAVLCSAILSACTDSEYNKARQDFIDGCTGSGFQEKVCTCAFDKAAADFSKKEIVQMNQGKATQAQISKLMENLTGALPGCL